MKNRKIGITGMCKYFIRKLMLYFFSFSVAWSALFIVAKSILVAIAWEENEIRYPIINKIAAYLFEVMFGLWLFIVVGIVIYYWKRILEMLQGREEEERKRKNDMLAYLAHDIRTPLTSIMGYTHLLSQMKTMLNEEARDYIEVIGQKSEQLEVMLEEFFEITKLETDCVRLDLVEIDLIKMLEQIIEEYQPILKEKQFTILTQLDSIAVVRCDTSLMERVFDNLIRNAMKYATHSLVLQVTSEVKKDKLHISFSNTAEPMTEEELVHIFDFFVRLDEARGEIEGSGMGLAIVKDIIELHKGEVWAEYQEDKLQIHITLNIIKSS